ncbi:MAG TPA: YihY/virulence factor BrkB family protein [Acidimicrobiales bacterium]|nr:YihY/virulence factor BrkB family protein [Acidimicrobiales bacterium]
MTVTGSIGRSLRARLWGVAGPLAGRGRRLLRRHRWLAWVATVARRTVGEIFADRLLRLAAEAAFWSLLSLPPLLLGLLGLVGYVGTWFGHGAVARIDHDILAAAHTVLTPRAVQDTIRPLVDRILGQGHANIASVGFVISFWSGSAAMNAYVDAITVAYDMDGLRPGWRTRVLALALYVLALLGATILLPVLALGPNLLTVLAPQAVTPAVSALVHNLYWPAVGAGSLVLLATLYWLAVPVRSPWVRGLPGAVLTMVVWLAGAFGIRAYLTSGLRHTSTYGPLAAPLAVLLVFYVTALAVLLGAELNAVLDRARPHPSTTEGRQRAVEVAQAAPPPGRRKDPG